MVDNKKYMSLLRNFLLIVNIVGFIEANKNSRTEIYIYRQKLILINTRKGKKTYGHISVF
jgi:hypothetical protein